jgi:hypothetical protein
MKDIIDSMKDKREKRQKAGKAGGEAKRDNAQPGDDGNQGNDGVANPIKDNLLQQEIFATENPSKTDFAVANDNGNVNGNVNGNENGNGPPSFPPFLNPNFSNTTGPPEKNYAMIFEEVKAKWKAVVGQETKENLFQVSPTKLERFINTLAIYSLEDIFNAIGNYNIARNDPEEFDIGGRIYGNLVGFLENGVSQFFEDGTAESNFRRPKHDG